LKEEDMGKIMVYWEDEWNIPPVETGPSEKYNLKIHEVYEYE
jgi:hypothetical protein